MNACKSTAHGFGQPLGGQHSKSSDAMHIATALLAGLSALALAGPQAGCTRDWDCSPQPEAGTVLGLGF